MDGQTDAEQPKSDGVPRIDYRPKLFEHWLEETRDQPCPAGTKPPDPSLEGVMPDRTMCDVAPGFHEEMMDRFLEVHLKREGYDAESLRTLFAKPGVSASIEALKKAWRSTTTLAQRLLAADDERDTWVATGGRTDDPAYLEILARQERVSRCTTAAREECQKMLRQLRSFLRQAAAN